MVGAASTEPKPKTDAVEIPSDKTGCTGSNLFLLSRFFVRIPRCTRSCDHTAAVRNSRARPARATGVAGRGGRDGAVAPGKAEARRRGPRFSRPRNVGACHAKLYNPEPRGRAGRWCCGLPKFPKPRRLLNSRAHITRSLSLASRDSIAVGVRLVVPGVRAGAAGGRRIEPTKLCRSSWPWRSRRTSWR